VNKILLNKDHFIILTECIRKRKGADLTFYQLKYNRNNIFISENAFLASRIKDKGDDLSKRLKKITCRISVKKAMDAEWEGLLGQGETPKIEPIKEPQLLSWRIIPDNIKLSKDSLLEKNIEWLFEQVLDASGIYFYEKGRGSHGSERHRGSGNLDGARGGSGSSDDSGGADGSSGDTGNRCKGRGVIVGSRRDRGGRSSVLLTAGIDVVSLDIKEVHLSRRIKGKTASIEQDEIHNRTMLWLGINNFKKIKNCTLGCIGAGGMMNPFIISAMHHGFERFIIIDDDKLEASNLNRFIGAEKKDIGKYKAALLKKVIERYNQDASVEIMNEKFPFSRTESLICLSDIIVVGVDNDFTRFNAQMLGLTLNKTIFDMAGGIYLKDSASLSPGIDERGGQVRVSVPGHGCLVCMGLDPSQIVNFKREELDKRRGYIAGTDLTPPSVVTLNQTIASLCLRMVVSYITGCGLPSLHIKYDEKNLRLYSVTVERAKDCPLCGVLSR
jgi:molybdopterin/thiamine biosynthesis adenylyltransferase